MEVLNSLLPLRNIGLTCSSSQSRLALPSPAALQSQVGFSHKVSKGFKGLTSKQLKWQDGTTLTKRLCTVLRSSGDSNSKNTGNDLSGQNKIPFGYTRKDVILIGVVVTGAGWGLKSGLEYFGVDPLQAGNVVQLVIVLGLTVGWISTYVFRVSNKEMTYAQQLRDYESKVMEKRLESLTEAELEALLEQVEEEKTRVDSKKTMT